MSWKDYQASKRLSLEAHEGVSNPFYSLLMAAIREADTVNLCALEEAFPDVCAEFKARYHAHGGFLMEERGRE